MIVTFFNTAKENLEKPNKQQFTDILIGATPSDIIKAKGVEK